MKVHIGGYTLLAARAVGHVYAFDLSLANYRALRR